MPGMGTVINCACILAGGLIGLLLKKGMPQRFQDILMSACGLSVIFLGIAGTLEEMLVIENGFLTTRGTMMLIFSLCIGAAVGEALNIELYTEKFGAFIREKSGSTGDPRFVDGFVTTSLTICIGAMAVVGSIEDGISHDISTLTAKAVLDFVIVLVMASSMGKGCLFSFIPVGIFQGSITALARILQPFLTPAAIANLSLVGSMLIFCVGINLMFQDKVKIKVANLLPSIIFAMLAAGVGL